MPFLCCFDGRCPCGGLLVFDNYQSRIARPETKSLSDSVVVRGVVNTTVSRIRNTWASPKRRKVMLYVKAPPTRVTRPHETPRNARRHTVFLLYLV